MDNTSLKDKLTLKNVTEEHLDQFNELMNYVFQVTHSEISRIGNKNIINWKRPLLKSCDVIGWFEAEKLISQVMTFPFMVNIHGRAYKMGGVTGVGTYPEYAGYGLMHDLLKVSLQNMRAKGQTISYIYPYSVSYYKKKGWEIISDKIIYTIKDTQLPKSYEVSGRTIRVDIDHEDISKIYQIFSEHTHASMLRNALAWEEHFRWEKPDLLVAVYYDHNDIALGYVFYKVENETFLIKEIVVLNEEARRGLWNFIRAHFSMVYLIQGTTFTNEPLAFLISDGELEEKISPYFMARVVDVYSFLKLYPFTLPLNQNGPTGITFQLSDPMADWNSGLFSVNFNKDSVIINNSEQHFKVILDIQTFTTMMLSYKRPHYLKRVGRIDGSLDAINFLETIIPNNQPWFADYF